MKRIIILSVFLVLLSLTQGQQKIGPEPKVSTTQKPTEAPTEKPKTTTLAPTTIPTVPTTTPTVPTTTATTTTTVPPPTTKSTTTTPAPTTPTTTATTAKPSPTPTPKPTPKPEPVGTWAITYPNSNLTCIILKMELHLKVPYMSTDNKTLNASIAVPSTAEPLGECVDEDSQNITLAWNEKKNTVRFVFERNETSKQFMLASISAAITPDSANFPNMTNNTAIVNAALNKHEFITPLSMSYRCNKEETLDLPLVENENKTMKFVVSNLQMEAFHNATGTSFSSAQECEESETPGIVPIAVGCSLAALIILVLIAYLVGRRRSQARGYLSM